MEAIRISSLTRYYVNRYSLKSFPNGNASSGLGNYRKAIERILQRKVIGEKTLWEIIKNENQQRLISIEDFEKYCFVDFAKYIEANSCGYDKAALEADKIRFDETYIHKIDWDCMRSPTDMEILNVAHGYMIEAIYSLFFEKIDMLKLMDDLLIYQNAPSSGIEFSPEERQATDRLKDYKNYIGPKKTK